MKYFSLYPEKNKAHGIAYAPKGMTFKILYRLGRIVEWQPVGFEMRNGCFTDYQWNNLGWHMCSARLRDVFIDSAGPTDDIQWLQVVVQDSGAESRDYFVLHLPTPIDVLCKARTIMSGDHVVKPVFQASKIGVRRVFTYSSDSVSVYISEDVMKQIRAARVTGLDFLRVPVCDESKHECY